MLNSGDEKDFAFGAKNYKMMMVGLGILALGFIIMLFGDATNFGFDALGLTIGPIVVMAGFIFQFYAIFVQDKGDESTSDVNSNVEKEVSKKS